MWFSKQPEEQQLWSLVSNDSLHWESWGEQHAVYSNLSGETHLLPDLTWKILRELNGRANTAKGLAQALSAGSDTTATGEDNLIVDITRLLLQLQATGLVEKSTQ